VKALDWNHLDNTLEEQVPGAADIILLSDVVYFPHLWKPLPHTVLLLSTQETLVLWANCDGYAHFTPDLAGFLALIEPFYSVIVEEERLQSDSGGHGGNTSGRVAIRSLRLLDSEVARDEVEKAMEKSCIVKRCLG